MRFSYDIEMKTREQNRNNKRTEIEQFDWFTISTQSSSAHVEERDQERIPKPVSTGVENDWFAERIQTRVALSWLSEQSGEKTSCPRDFLEINRYFALTSYCNTTGQSKNAFSILGFSLAGKRRVHVLIFSSID